MSKRLAKAALDWWEDHQHDTEGDYGEFNVYDEEPEFVKIAREEIDEKDENSPDHYQGRSKY